MESTGVYHEAIALHLKLLSPTGEGEEVSQSLGLFHKIDKANSYMLVRHGYAQCKPISFWEPEPVNLRVIKALVRRLSALEKFDSEKSNRLEASTISDSCRRVLSSIDKIIHILNEEIRDVENEIDTLILACPVMKKNHELLLSINV